MAAEENQRWVLASRPSGWPTRDDFRLESGPIVEPGPGEALVQTRFVSVDPYMRGRMRDAKSYAPPVKLGAVMVGGGVGRVLRTGAGSRVTAGDIVEGQLGWQSHATLRASALRRLDPEAAPVSTALGVLGMPGMTAYFGLFDVIRPRPGDTIVVSGAAGAVGSVVGQLAKLSGCRAIGIAGTQNKAAWLRDELGFDGVIDYKRDDVSARLRELAPDGIDGYFDNVGGPITDAAVHQLALRGRVAVCGQISQYNDESAAMGPRNLWHLIAKRARVEGFLIFDYAARRDEALTRLTAWFRAGQLKHRETIVEGLSRIPDALIEMMRGANIGKMLVRVGD